MTTQAELEARIQALELELETREAQVERLRIECWRHLTPARARELLSQPNPLTRCTPAEDAAVCAVWDTLPGNSSWLDALATVAHRAD